MLPDASGVVVLRAVRRRNLSVRIAVVTGSGAESAALAEALRWKPDEVFHKPLVWVDIERWLGLS